MKCYVLRQCNCNEWLIACANVLTKLNAITWSWNLELSQVRVSSWGYVNKRIHNFLNVKYSKQIPLKYGFLCIGEISTSVKIFAPINQPKL